MCTEIEKYKVVTDLCRKVMKNILKIKQKSISELFILLFHTRIHMFTCTYEYRDCNGNI